MLPVLKLHAWSPVLQNSDRIWRMSFVSIKNRKALRDCFSSTYQASMDTFPLFTLQARSPLHASFAILALFPKHPCSPSLHDPSPMSKKVEHWHYVWSFKVNNEKCYMRQFYLPAVLLVHALLPLHECEPIVPVLLATKRYGRKLD